MSKKMGKMFESKFVRNIAIVTGGTAFAQLLNIILSPLITRIYPPEEYGVLAVYVSILTLLSIGASLDYQKAIPLATNDKSAFNLIGLSFLTLSLFVLMTVLTLLFFGEEILTLFGSEVLLKYKYLIPIGILFVGIYNILLHWSLRTKDFKTVTSTKVNQSIAANLTQIGLGLMSVGPVGLIFGQIIGQSAGIRRLSLPLFNREKSVLKSITFKDMKSVAKRYMKFPLFSCPSNYVYTAGSQAPVIILALMFGSSVTGHYGLANTIVNLPISLLAMSVSQVFYSEIASIGKSNPKKIKNLSLNLSKKLVIIGLLPLSVFVFFGPWLFSFVFGAEWYEAGVYAQIISVIAFSHFIILPCGRILEVIEKQNMGLIINILRLIFIIIAFYVADFIGLNSYQTILLYTITSSVTYFLLFIFVQVSLTKDLNP